jgi:hypothetical protein
MKGNRDILIEKLEKKNAFWSYGNIRDADDDVLIEKVMLLLDIDEIDILFKIFDRNFIRKVWEERVLNQEPMYHGLNRFYAWFYFGIEDPDEFLKNRKMYLA